MIAKYDYKAAYEKPLKEKEEYTKKQHAMWKVKKAKTTILSLRRMSRERMQRRGA